MAQHDMSIANQSGAAFRADLNDALAALVSNNSGATEPATTFAYQLWADTTAAVLKQRNAANNAWVTLFKLADGAVPSVQTQLATRFTAGGTADAITGTLSPAIASYTAGLRVTTTPGGANTVTGPTLNLNTLGTKTIKKRDSSGTKVALVAGDYNASGPFDFEYDGTDFVLLNPLAATTGSTDQIARDQISLTNMRLMLNSAVTTGALVQGKQWELATDEWSASSLNENYTSGTPNYYGNTGVVSQSAGTTIGNMTNGGGLAAAFDGSASQTMAAGAQNASASAGYVGKDWGASNTRIITQAVVDSSNDNGFSNTYNSGTNTIELQGSTDNFSSSVVSLGSTVTGTEGATRITATVTASDVSTAYRYHRIKITNSNGGNQIYCCAEVVFSESNNSTLIPPAAVSVSVAPTYMDAYFLWKDDSGSAVLGTDLTVELSRDNGATYTAATLTNLGSFDGTYSIVKARAGVSAQPSGTSLLCRIKTLNNKAQRVAAPALYAE